METHLRGTMPKDRASHFNQGLIEIGAIVCVPNGAPHCAECPLESICLAKRHDLIGEIPVKTPPKKRRLEDKTVCILECGDQVGLNKRDDSGLLASLYEFPNLEGKLSGKEVLEQMKCRAVIEKELPTAKHIFSHVEWHMSGYLIRVTEEIPGLLFADREELKEKYPIPNAFAAYRKIAAAQTMDSCES